MEFELQSEYIELIKLLKILGIAESGGEAKQMVNDGMISFQNQTESRKRLKLRKGDQIRVNEITINIV